MFRDQRNGEDNCRYVSSESSLLIRLFSLIRKTGILYLISKVEYVNLFEHKNSSISNFSSQFSILEL